MLLRRAVPGGVPLTRRRFVGTGLAGLGAVAAGPLLAGCGESGTGIGQPSDDPDSDPRLTARPGTPTIAPVTGVTDLGLESGRDGILYVPESIDPGTSEPLIVALHGAGARAGTWGSYFGFAEEQGFVLLATDSRTLSWDIAEIGLFGPDVQFLDRALAHTFARVRVDTSRVALIGFSDGASYALSLGVSNGDLFTHLAAHSAGFFLPERPIVGRPVVYQSHGTSDPILPIASGRFVEGLLREDGYDLLFREFAGGHELPLAITLESLDWFLGTG